MKKITWILTISCTLLSISSTYAGPGDEEKKQSLTLFCIQGSHTVINIMDETTMVDIFANCTNSSTIEINVPSSVKNINLKGSALQGSTVILYMHHNPTINVIDFSCLYGSSLRTMHPIRKYTYHIAALAAIGALAYYFTREK